jgi:hypothetical protein
MFALAAHLYRADAQFGVSGETALGTIIELRKFSRATRGRGNFEHYEAELLRVPGIGAH